MGKFDSYKIDLKGMQADSKEYAFVLDTQFFTHIDAPEVQKGKVEVKLTVKRTARAFELTFHTDGVVWVPCDRCLDDMEVAITSTDKLLVKFGSDYGSEGDNLIIVPEEEGEINVAWYMYEFIALAIPMKHIHPPGKCNKQMTGKLNKHRVTTGDDEEDATYGIDEADIDEIPTESEETPTDPRWNDLQKILDNN
ncbi:MAG: DUF177 domain-containing protein [Mediterranea sp.]|nr:DUF177 domain-containing protein [Mediterranea sp.]